MLSHRWRKLRVECFEPRLLMAGNVAAFVVSGDLVMNGDDQDNYLSIAPTANAGEFTVTGINDGDGVATSINGTPNGTATLAGVTRDMLVTLLAGDDRIVLTEGMIPRDLVLDVGAGNDSVSAGGFQQPLNVGRNVSIQVGDGSNTVTEFEVHATGRHLVEGSPATPAERNIPNSFFFADGSVGDVAVFRPGDRAASITVTQSNFAGDLNFHNYIPPGTQPPFGTPRIGDIYSSLALSNSHVVGTLQMSSVTATRFQLLGNLVESITTLQSAGDNNLFELRNNSLLRNLNISTAQPTNGPLGNSRSAYDSVQLENVSVGAGWEFNLDTSGDLHVLHSAFGTAIVNPVTSARIEASIFNQMSVNVGQSFSMRYSIVHGTATIINSRFRPGGPLDPAQSGQFDGYSETYIFGSRLTTLNFTGGNNTDALTLEAAAIDNLFARMGDGSDLLAASGSIANQQAQLNGEAGFDLLRLNANQFNGFAVANFEG